MIVRICVVSCALFLLGIIAASSRADESASSPSTEPSYTADQSNDLKAANGKAVMVQGTVGDIEDLSENVMRISFKESPQNDFVGIVFSKKTPAVHDYFEGPDGSALIGKRINLHGKISLYRGKPEIVISDVKQVEVVGAVSTQPAA